MLLLLLVRQRMPLLCKRDSADHIALCNGQTHPNSVAANRLPVAVAKEAMVKGEAQLSQNGQHRRGYNLRRRVAMPQAEGLPAGASAVQDGGLGSAGSGGGQPAAAGTGRSSRSFEALWNRPKALQTAFLAVLLCGLLLHAHTIAVVGESLLSYTATTTSCILLNHLSRRTDRIHRIVRVVNVIRCNPFNSPTPAGPSGRLRGGGALAVAANATTSAVTMHLMLSSLPHCFTIGAAEHTPS